MKISAKFKSFCRLCQKPIRVGEDIDYEKGQKAVHWRCELKRSATPTPQRTIQTPTTNQGCDCLGMGWVHIQEKQIVQRCDRCMRFKTDAEAALSHDRDCGCDWRPRGKSKAGGQKASGPLAKGVFLYSKFDGKCKGCGEPYGAGSSIVWYGKGGGCYHPACDLERQGPAGTSRGFAKQDHVPDPEAAAPWVDSREDFD